MEARAGTYALLLEATAEARIQVGRWREIDLQCGYYIYIGSAFGPGGVAARVLRHQRLQKKNHWHIDYLRQHCDVIGAWYSYHPARLEHKWAAALDRVAGYTGIKGFGCSDCGCNSHLFFTLIRDGVVARLGDDCQEVEWHEF